LRVKSLNAGLPESLQLIVRFCILSDLILFKRTMKPGKTGLSRIADAFGYSFKGLKFAWKHEAAFRQELIFSIFLIALAVFLSETFVECILLITPVFIVLVVELLNSAIEAVVDRISDEHHDLSGAAKDIASAAVFVSLILTAVVWTVFLFNKYFL